MPKYEEIKLGRKVHPSLLPILAAAIIFPSSVILWIGNYLLGWVTTLDDEESAYLSKIYFVKATDSEDITPSRWLLSVAFPVIFTLYGLRKNSLSGSGAALALLVGFFLTLSSYCFLMSLMIFFLTSSKATKFRAHKKQAFEDDFKEGGQRNWIQVLCNGGMAAELAILYLMDIGVGQRVINFRSDYRASWLGMGILGALSCATGDTWASELGTVIGSSSPRLITTLRKVPKGTNGGVTLQGFIVSLLGGLFVGLGYYLVLVLTIDPSILVKSPPQWPVMFMGAAGGFFGSVIDSYLGATLQFSGIDTSGKIKEIPGPDVKHISGFCFLDNHSVNLLSTILTGLLLPSIALLTWPS